MHTHWDKTVTVIWFDFVTPRALILSSTALRLQTGRSASQRLLIIINYINCQSPLWMCCSQQWVSGPFMGVFELVEHNYREDKGGNLCFISTCFKGWTEAKAAWLRAQLWHNVQSSSSTSSCVILLWKTGKHPIVLPKESIFFQILANAVMKNALL